MEWVHRLCREPGRLGKRYLREDLPYAVKLLASSALRKDKEGDEDEWLDVLTPLERRAWNAPVEERPDHVPSRVNLDVPAVRRRPSPRPHR
jgi:hypothetical protein